MKQIVRFICLDADDKDLIISFAIDDQTTGIKSLILHRALFGEKWLENSEKGVNVTLEDDNTASDALNILQHIQISANAIEIRTSLKTYQLDISNISIIDRDALLALLKRQNKDQRFVIKMV